MSPIILTGSGGSDRTFLDLQDEALADDFSPTKYRTRVKQWLNEGEREVFRRARVPEGEGTMPIATVAGEPTVDMPASLVVRLNSLRNTTDRAPLEELAIEQVDTEPAATGKPGAFALVGNVLVLSPTPDAVYQLEGRVQARPGVMAADGDHPTLQDDYVPMLVTFARHKLFRAEDDFDAANYYMTEFETDVAKLRRDIGRRTRSRRRQVPGMFAGSSSPTFVRPS